MKVRWKIAIVVGIPLLAAVAISGLGARDTRPAGTTVTVEREVAAPGAVGRREEEEAVGAAPAAWVVGGVVVDGTVRDLYGNVVAGATVMAAGVVAETDAAGRFALRVTPGVIVVRASVDGHAPAERELTAPASGVTLVLVPAAEVRGVVVERGTRAPVAGVEVIGRGLATPGLGLPPVARAVAVTDGAGRFALAGLPPGRYDVGVETAGWAGWLAEPVDANAARPVDDLIVELAPRARVVAEPAAGSSVRGRAVDAHGRPLVDAVIAVEPDGDDVWTDRDGAFEARGLAPGAYTFAVMSADRRPRSDALAVVVDAGGRAADVLLVARAEGRLRGRIDDPPPGTVLTAFAASEAGDVAETRVRADGTFTFDDLTPGAHRVTVCDPWAGALATADARVSAARPADVSLRAPRFDVVLEGRVVDATGHPAGAAVVTAASDPDESSPCVSDDEARAAVPTDDQGRFRLPALPRRTYRVRATGLDGDEGLAEAAPGAHPVIQLGAVGDSPDPMPPQLDRR